MSKKEMKYVVTMPTCYQIVKSIDGKQVYFSSVNLKKPYALKQVKRMRDVVVAMLDAEKSIDEIKVQIKSMNFQRPKETMLFLESMKTTEINTGAEESASLNDSESAYQDFEPPAEVMSTETVSTSADSGIVVVEGLDVTVNTQEQLVSFASLNGDSLKQFSELYATIKTLEIPEQDAKRFDEIFEDLDVINGTIDRLNSRLESHLPHAELLFYKNECEVLTKDKRSLQNRLTRAEKKVAV